MNCLYVELSMHVELSLHVELFLHISRSNSPIGIKMNLYIFVISAIIVYIIDIFALIWLSGKFVGIQNLSLKDIGVLGLSIILLSWLIGTAVYHVPLIIKPAIILFAFALIVYFFILILDTQFLKATAAGLFFLLCQVVFIIVVLRQFWSNDFFQIVRYLFNLY